jgi:hypothetical protein
MEVPPPIGLNELNPESEDSNTRDGYRKLEGSATQLAIGSEQTPGRL